MNQGGLEHDDKATDRWEGEGGTTPRRKTNRVTELAGNQITLLPPFEHKEPADDDCGLPQHPIYSNYSKYLWTSHARTGGAEAAPPAFRPDPDE